MNTLQLFLSQTNWITTITVVCQWTLLFIGFCWLWRKMTGTQSERLLKGLIITLVICGCAVVANLTVFTAILQQLAPFALIALIIIFQPEIRRSLISLGRIRFFFIPLLTAKQNTNELAQNIAQIILATKELAKNKYGALIVVEPPDSDHDYLSPGTPVNADLSSNLILSIFFPKSPLHDGAIIVQHNKIKAAGVILPITDNRKLSYIYGTRHRAALGLSEIFNCLCIVVSEETGSISTAYHGALKQFQEAEELTDCLNQFYGQSLLITSSTILDSELENVTENSA